MNRVRVFYGLCLAFFGSACATTFSGNSHVEDGRAGCERKCKTQNMEVSGMVYMGEYSDACICAVPPVTGAAPAPVPAPAPAPTQTTAPAPVAPPPAVAPPPPNPSSELERSRRDRVLADGAAAAVAGGTAMTHAREEQKLRAQHLPWPE